MINKATSKPRKLHNSRTNEGQFVKKGSLKDEKTAPPFPQIKKSRQVRASCINSDQGWIQEFSWSTGGGGALPKLK